jgi:hypothetical protein
MKTVKNFFIAILAGLPILMTVSCNKDSAETAYMKFHLTDAPEDYEAVYIDIRGIEIHTQAEGWVVLNSDLGVVNLLEYTNGNTTFLADGEVATGRISQIRLILGSENSIVADGQAYPLQTPSALQSGLKLNIHTTIEPNQTYEWTIDFDAAQSVVVSGTGSYILKPVLRLIVDPATGAELEASANTDVNLNVGGNSSASGSASSESEIVIRNQTGHIKGKLIMVGDLVMVYATDAHGRVYSTIVDATGSFKLQFLAEGNYDIKIQPSNPLLQATIVNNIEVKANQTSDLGIM